jgi:hypothetical protein
LTIGTRSTNGEDGLAGVRGAIDIIVPMAQDTMAIRFGIMARSRPRAESAQRAGLPTASALLPWWTV